MKNKRFLPPIFLGLFALATTVGAADSGDFGDAAGPSGNSHYHQPYDTGGDDIGGDMQQLKVLVRSLQDRVGRLEDESKRHARELTEFRLDKMRSQTIFGDLASHYERIATEYRLLSDNESKGARPAIASKPTGSAWGRLEPAPTKTPAPMYYGAASAKVSRPVAVAAPKAPAPAATKAPAKPPSAPVAAPAPAKVKPVAAPAPKAASMPEPSWGGPGGPASGPVPADDEGEGEAADEADEAVDDEGDEGEVEGAGA